jgi:cysteine-S-conjugate beta-lyase
VSSRFDRVVKRRGTGSVKWDHYGDPPDLIPMWVADMDFEIPDAVADAISSRTRHRVWGYPAPSTEFVDLFVEWVASRFGAAYDGEWVVPIPGVLTGMAVAIQACSAPGDAVVVLSPVYYPFYSAVERSGRRLAAIPLERDSLGRYSIDFDSLEREFASGATMMLFCSPHNPVSRVWTDAELERLLHLADRYSVTIVCDEIHQDLVLGGRRQRPLVEVWRSRGGEAEGAPVVSVTAATKTFNLAGLGCGYLVAPHRETRATIRASIEAGFLGMLNTLSVVATVAAYRHGAPWLDELLGYLDATHQGVRNAFAAAGLERLLTPIEGTYLLWIDLRGFGEHAVDEVRERGRVRLSDGAQFGAAGFGRMNLAAPRSVVLEGVRRVIGLAGESEPRR